MGQAVAVQRPDAGIVGREENVDPLARADKYGVHFQRIADGSAVPGHNEKLVGVGVYVVGLEA
jgi:hypothetical protein